jgi:hypothetical protein
VKPHISLHRVEFLPNTPRAWWRCSDDRVSAIGISPKACYEKWLQERTETRALIMGQRKDQRGSARPESLRGGAQRPAQAENAAPPDTALKWE